MIVFASRFPSTCRADCRIAFSILAAALSALLWQPSSATAQSLTELQVGASDAGGEFKRQTPIDLEPSRAGAENILAQFPGGSVRIEDYIDGGLLDELNKQGFLAEMRRKIRAAVMLDCDGFEGRATSDVGSSA